MMRILVALSLLLAACSTSAPSEGEAAGSLSDAPPVAQQPGPASDPAARPGPQPGPQPERQPTAAEELVALGVVLTDGFSPHGHLGRTGGMLNWPPRDQMPQGIGDPPVPDGLGPLVIEARIQRFPVSCIEWMRTIASVDVGAGAAARAIADEIVRVADHEHGRFLSSYSVEEDCAGLVPGAASSVGDTYIELSEEPCELPGGPPLRCFVVAGFGYPAGAAHTYLRHYQLVFDTRTGERLDLEELFAGGGVDADLGLALTDEIVRTITGMSEVTIRQARPTLEGLMFGFSPYEAGSWVEYARDVTIPWSIYRTAERARG